jgi:hypothetical protein
MTSVSPPSERSERWGEYPGGGGGVLGGVPRRGEGGFWKRNHPLDALPTVAGAGPTTLSPPSITPR